MNKRGHVVNAVLLAVGLGYVLEPSGNAATYRTIAAVFVPVVLGALFPDIDTAFGKHRKTLHNVWVLAVFLAYPVVFDNLHYVWIGVLSHFALDFLGTKRGLALLYPLTSAEWDFPYGVSTSSHLAEVVTVGVTLVELALFAALYHVLPGALPPELTEGARQVAALFGS